MPLVDPDASNLSHPRKAVEIQKAVLALPEHDPQTGKHGEGKDNENGGDDPSRLPLLNGWPSFWLAPQFLRRLVWILGHGLGIPEDSVPTFHSSDFCPFSFYVV